MTTRSAIALFSLASLVTGGLAAVVIIVITGQAITPGLLAATMTALVVPPVLVSMAGYVMCRRMR